MDRRHPRSRKSPPSGSADEPVFPLAKSATLGTSGAVVGAIVAGPIGALVGGVVGSAFGAVAGVQAKQKSPATPTKAATAKAKKSTPRRRRSATAKKKSPKASAQPALRLRRRRT